MFWQHVLSAIQTCKKSGAYMKARYWENALSLRMNGDSYILRNIASKGNPFLIVSQTPRSESHVSFQQVESRNASQYASSTCGSNQRGDAEEANVFSSICDLLDNEYVAVPPIATDSVNNVLVKWTYRLLSVMLKLPLVVEDVTKIFRDLCDLYFITSFRLCAGNVKNEKIILGIEPPSPVVSQEILEQGLRSPRINLKKESSSFMGFGRRPSNSSMGHHRRGSGRGGSGRGSGSPAANFRNVEAEMCAPLPSEALVISELRDFVTAGQENLKTVVKLEKLEQRLMDPIPETAIDADFIVELVHVLKKRQATAWSCLIVAALLDVTCRQAEQTLSRSFLNEMIGVNGSQASAEAEESNSLLNSLASYSKKVSHVAPYMVKLSSRIACVHALLGERVVKEVRRSQSRRICIASFADNFIDAPHYKGHCGRPCVGKIKTQ